MKLIYKRDQFGRWLSFESRPVVVQLLPNLYVQLGPFNLAVDRHGFLFCYPRGHCGFIRSAGFHRGRC